MRVIAGTAKRIPLETIEGLETRPTTDRIKETLFNMIQPHMADTTFLDLFSGSGAIGIEALSRGAKRAVFVEMNIKAVGCIKKNLLNTKLSERAEVLRVDACSAIHRMAGKEVFDYVFMDPPYDMGLERNVLIAMAEHEILSEDGLIIIEASVDTDFSYIESLGYGLIKEKIYRTNKHMFIEKIRG